MATTDAHPTEAVAVTHFEQAEWTQPAVTRDLPPELLERALAVRRKGLSDGTGGFFASHVEMPAGQEAVPHSHDHSELMIVVEGDMVFHVDDADHPLSRYDSIVVPARKVYGFTVGADGVRFLLIRGGKTTHRLES